MKDAPALGAGVIGSAGDVMFHWIVSLVLIVVAGCHQSESAVRWYSSDQVVRGKVLFARHCASCHGAQAQGLAADWKQRLPDGSLPPPPLNGSAHAWHHPLPLLLQIIQQGGALYDGNMPAFADMLSENEQKDVVAWFQSLWSDETYLAWNEIGQSEQFGGKR